MWSVPNLLRNYKEYSSRYWNLRCTIHSESKCLGFLCFAGKLHFKKFASLKDYSQILPVEVAKFSSNLEIIIIKSPQIPKINITTPTEIWFPAINGSNFLWFLVKSQSSVEKFNVFPPLVSGEEIRKREVLVKQVVSRCLPQCLKSFTGFKKPGVFRTRVSIPTIFPNFLMAVISIINIISWLSN